MTVVSAPVMAQNTDQQVANITKVIMDNKSNLEAVEDQVKDFVKENKKNPLALAGLGRAFFDAKDTTSAKKYAEMAIDRGKNEAEGYILLGDIEAMKNDGGAAATWYQQATIMDPQEPQGFERDALGRVLARDFKDGTYKREREVAADSGFLRAEKGEVARGKSHRDVFAGRRAQVFERRLVRRCEDREDRPGCHEGAEPKTARALETERLYRKVGVQKGQSRHAGPRDALEPALENRFGILRKNGSFGHPRLSPGCIRKD